MLNHLVDGAEQVADDGVIGTHLERLVGEPLSNEVGDDGRGCGVGRCAAVHDDAVIVEQETSVTTRTALRCVFADNLAEAFLHRLMWLGGAEARVDCALRDA